MKKIIISIILIGIVAIGWTRVVDNNAIKFNNETIKNVGITLLGVRAINAGLSVIQDSSIDVGIGVGAEIAVGEFVNPINDFLDRFSWILLFSLISLGVQNFIILLLKTNLINILLTITSLLFIASLFTQKLNKTLLSKILVFVLFVRFATPLIGDINGYIYNFQMKQELQKITQENIKFQNEIKTLFPNFEDNKAKINLLKQKIQILETEKNQIINNALQNSSYFQQLKAKFHNYSSLSDTQKQQIQNIDATIDNLKQQINALNLSYSKKFEIFKQNIKKLTSIIKHKISLYYDRAYTTIYLFITRAVVLPFVFLWLLWIITKELLNFDITNFIQWGDKNELLIKNG